MKTRLSIAGGAFLALCATTTLSLAQVPIPNPQRLTNGPPSVRIVTPQEGAELLFGRTIHICALSLNFTGAVARVQFFAGTNLLGVVTNGPIVSGPQPCGMPRRDYSCLTWSNAATGAYTLSAAATDVAGNSATSAPVDITVVTNLQPRVRIVRPCDGAIIRGPTNITICASAFDPDGTVARVRFFQGTNSLGVVTNTPTVWVTNDHGVFPIRQTTYSLTWTNVPPGAYSLTAEAIDNVGASTLSAAVDITVVTNLPPFVRIAQPQNGARFFSPANLSICAAAKDPDGTVARVEFFQGTNSLGVVTTGTTVTNGHDGVQTLYCLTWSNVPPATYSLKAVATDNVGASSASLPVSVTVVVPPPPMVKIVYPENGARFFAPANIYIATTTRYFTNPIASVRFLAGTNTLGVVTNSSWPTFCWRNVSPGAYSLTAVATDTASRSATSAPVNITVVTNRPAPPPIWRR